MGTKAYQIEPTIVNSSGEEIHMYFKSRAEDVSIGSIPASSSVQIPANSEEVDLYMFVADMKKWCENLQEIAAEKRNVSDSIDSASTIDLASLKAVSKLKDMISSITTDVNGKAPTYHSSSSTSYGGGTSTLYGHVKVNDSYSTSAGSAAESVAASSKAVVDAYTTLNSEKAPTSHASSDTTYGIGTSSVYGHLKISDTYSAEVTGSAIAASQKGLYEAYAELISKDSELTTNIGEKAPINHAVSATTYGSGNSTLYGHVKISDSYNTENASTGAASNGVVASSYALYLAYANLSTSIGTKLTATHADEKATASVYSHVKLTDSYTSSGGAASAGVAPSSKALVDAYNTLSTSIGTKLASSHANEKATASVYSHVKLTDSYTSSGGAAADAVAPSSKALVDAYNALVTSINTLTNSVNDSIKILQIKTAFARNEGAESGTTTFNTDGSITSVTDTTDMTTTFNTDGSITAVLKLYSDSTKGTLISTITKVTTFNDDGTITETVTTV